jgi:hypothetical protein
MTAYFCRKQCSTQPTLRAEASRCIWKTTEQVHAERKNSQSTMHDQALVTTPTFERAAKIRLPLSWDSTFAHLQANHAQR